uniref:TPR-like protein n=1 Tax=Mycena chlorophos TaxID=658473 RepID=A0ABQ0KVI5_MYCCL|nr:predicted protein [Mycena chlorophos]
MLAATRRQSSFIQSLSPTVSGNEHMPLWPAEESNMPNTDTKAAMGLHSLSIQKLSFGGGIGGDGGRAVHHGGDGGTGQGAQLNILSHNTYIGQPAWQNAEAVPLLQFFSKKIVLLPTRFRETFRVDASTTESLTTSFQDIAKAKNLQPTLNTVHNWLQTNLEEWMLLVDNADDPQLDLGPFLPHCGHGNILITSRNPNLSFHTGSPERSICVSNLEHNDATTLLLKISMANTSIPGALECASEIAEELHCFALAIVQAGAYIRQSLSISTNLKKYLLMLREKKNQLMAQKPHQTDSGYHFPLYGTWRLSFDMLSSAAQRLLQICSLLYHDGIMEDILKRAGTTQVFEDPDDSEEAVEDEKIAYEMSSTILQPFLDEMGQWNTDIFEQAMAEICGYSLMTSEENMYSIHPLVSQWAQTTILDLDQAYKDMIEVLGRSARETTGLREKANLALHFQTLRDDKAFILSGFGTECMEIYLAGGLFNAAGSVLNSYLELHSLENLGADLLQYISCRFFAYGQYSKAAYLQEVLLQSIETYDRGTIDLMRSLGTTYYYAGQYTKAQQLYEHMIDRLACHTHNSLDLLDVVAYLAVIYEALGKYRQAHLLEVIVLKEFAEILGQDHPSSIYVMGSLSSLYRYLGRYSDAEEITRRVLTLEKTVYGSDNLETIVSMSRLGSIYHCQGRYVEAQTIQEKVVHQCALLLGEGHPHTLIAQGRMAATLLCQGRYNEAQKLEEKIQKRLALVVGADHPETLIAKANLATTYCEQGLYKEASNLDEQVAHARYRLLSTEHPSTLDAVGNFADTYTRQEKYTEAKLLELDVLEARKTLLRTNHPETMATMGNLASTYHLLGKYFVAQAMQEEVVQKRQEILGPDHPDTLIVMV